ncbi:4Fe-4S ferredoxin [Sporanaerobium hydrogeniformans]|uniref:4Fe-4S ferredoxin n=1 Tax=Sporanaerobium hydrogeniformans TaxID=3072179 RepID=A0AC61DCI5_9FIRM|nr:[Fe-Fe] hydrogenase large subunit C-terminal domain-containing protein [Sporanaerobium hydrogeniformans]PHV71039.1 4Fe-4S ferredoxin [Sporanaerobium hydrogeniformans]
MWIINFSEADCKNCYACVRACPVHAIEVKAEQAQIMKERCIGCGRCLKACPKNAKQVKPELESVKEYVKRPGKVVATVAPTYVGVFGENASKLSTALKMLGFDAVEETVVGADFVTEQYEAYAQKEDDACYITSCCSSVVYLIEKHHPKLIPHLIPVVSPVVCHARMLKQTYGTTSKVVFIGPCLSKKIEGHEEESIDAVLTFDELEKWLAEENIHLNDLTKSAFDQTNSKQAFYPLVGGATKTVKQEGLKKQIIPVDGVEECKEVLKAIEEGSLKNILFEMNCCRHSCVGGPGLSEDGRSVYERKEWIKKYVKEQQKQGEGCKQTDMRAIKGLEIGRRFEPLYVPLKKPKEGQIREILGSIGKYTENDELNCGSCGYPTCRDKAIAVFNGMAEPNMCLPFMRQKAETLSNVIFDATPNLIIIVNKELEIIDLNPSAAQFFHTTKESMIDLPIEILLDTDIFMQVKEAKRNVVSQKKIVKNTQSTVIQSVIWIEYHQVMLWIAHDISRDEKLEKRLQTMKIDAINMAQQVINKQMTVAQEIASLLGETTAETKVTLTQLKHLIQTEEDVKP